MNIKVASINYTAASVARREVFAFTPLQIQALEQQILQTNALTGCIVLSTCNRTELWLSAPSQTLSTLSPIEILCSAAGVATQRYAPFFTTHSGTAAATYLSELACGLHSQIFGEDQILSQIKTALANARENGTTDATLELVFRTAITAAKAVKTQLKLTTADHNIALGAVALLQKTFGQNLHQLPCLVIGSGEMGRLAVQALQNAGCTVTMTLRNYHKKEAIVPAGCRVLNYDERMAHLNRFRVIISATLSPHQTIKYHELQAVLDNNPHTFIDLAIPRDIDCKIATLPQITLFGLDDLSLTPSPSVQTQQQQARQILQEHITQLEQQSAFRPWIPALQTISRSVAQDAAQRTAAGGRAPVEKAVAKLLYGLREQLSQEQLQLCMEALLRSVNISKQKGESL